MLTSFIKNVILNDYIKFSTKSQYGFLSGPCHALPFATDVITVHVCKTAAYVKSIGSRSAT